MSTTEYKDDFIESYVKIGLDQGLEQGLEQGAVSTKAEDVLKVLDVRDLKPTEAQRALVTGCADLAQLNLWFDRALTAKSATDVFK